MLDDSAALGLPIGTLESVVLVVFTVTIFVYAVYGFWRFNEWMNSPAFWIWFDRVRGQNKDETESRD